MATRVKREPSESARPTGTVTFAFTDIEGSTQRWDRDRAAMQDAVRRHDALMQTAITKHDGYVFKTIGDAFCAAFARPEDAVAAILDAQHALVAEDFSPIDGLRVRAAVHTGTVDERDGDYFGPARQPRCAAARDRARRSGARLGCHDRSGAGRAPTEVQPTRPRRASAERPGAPRSKSTSYSRPVSPPTFRRCARSTFFPTTYRCS